MATLLDIRQKQTGGEEAVVGVLVEASRTSRQCMPLLALATALALLCRLHLLNNCCCCSNTTTNHHPQPTNADALIRMLSLHATGREAAGQGGELYKVLVLDKSCRDIVAPLLRVAELRAHGVTLHLSLEAERQPIADVPAVYLVAPTPDNVDRIAQVGDARVRRGGWTGTRCGLSSTA
jgi:hypothetical protein